MNRGNTEKLTLTEETELHKINYETREKLELDGTRHVPDYVGGRPRNINAWLLYTHMVYL